MSTVFKTDMDGGSFLFVYDTPHMCRVIESHDAYMPVGTVFPAKDLKTLNCEVEEV